MEGQSLFLCVTGADQQINHPDLRLLLDELAKQLVLAQSGDC
jgi:hypothetical protein